MHSIIEYNIPPSIENNTDKPCFTAIVSLVHFTFGNARLIITPLIPQRRVNDIAARTHIIADNGDNPNAYEKVTAVRKVNGAVIAKCKADFAKNAVFGLIGRDLIIQRVFPSREIEGADMKLFADKSIAMPRDITDIILGKFIPFPSADGAIISLIVGAYMIIATDTSNINIEPIEVFNI